MEIMNLNGLIGFATFCSAILLAGYSVARLLNITNFPSRAPALVRCALASLIAVTALTAAPFMLWAIMLFEMGGTQLVSAGWELLRGIWPYL